MKKQNKIGAGKDKILRLMQSQQASWAGIVLLLMLLNTLAWAANKKFAGKDLLFLVEQPNKVRSEQVITAENSRQIEQEMRERAAAKYKEIHSVRGWLTAKPTFYASLLRSLGSFPR